MSLRLTAYSPGGGCACKLPQAALRELLASVPGNGAAALPAAGAALRVGLEAPDDAAIYAIDDARAWAISCDFLTPIVDDPYDWGRIAAANALSDVYAMGGRPLLALNLLAWPAELPREALAAVLRGGADTVAAAGALLVGGHSIVDPVPKYGLVAIGELDHPDAVLLRGGGVAGDALILTKPLGVGIVSTALKRGRGRPEQLEQAVATMTRLNADASAVAREAGLRGATDVTGYGLIGHLHEMALASGVAARIWPAAVPRLTDVEELVAKGCTPAGSVRTLEAALTEGWLDPGAAAPGEQALLADAQTSGGLLLCVPSERALAVTARLRARGDRAAAVVGELVPGKAGAITLVAGIP